MYDSKNSKKKRAKRRETKMIFLQKKIYRTVHSTLSYHFDMDSSTIYSISISDI